MSTSSMGLRAAGRRVYVGKPAGTEVLDPIDNQIGKVHDVVATFRVDGAGNVIGFVVEVRPRKRVFLPLTRITSIEAGSVITTNLLNMRSLTQRPVGTPVPTELFDRVVILNDGSGEVRILDVTIEHRHPKDWVILKLHVQCQRITALGFTRSSETLNVGVSEVFGFLKVGTNQATASLIAQTKGIHPADLADYFHDLPVKRQMAIAQQLPDACFADVLEEFGDDNRVAIVPDLEANRAAGVPDIVQPGDAADLVSELPEAQAQTFLSLMEPEEAKNVRRLLSCAESTAGSLMTTDPVIFSPDAAVAQMLTSARREGLPTSFATVVFITHPPEETPTGPYLGIVHIQRALREPPQTLLETILDSDIETVSPQVYIATATRLLATYNLTTLPVVNENSHLLGTVSIDDLLGELLPEDQRGYDDEIVGCIMARGIDG